MTLERLAREATPGPWRHFHGNGVDEISDGAKRVVVKWTGFDGADFTGSKAKANAAYIAAAHPQAILDLIERVRALEEAARELDKAIEYHDEVRDEVSWGTLHEARKKLRAALEKRHG